MCSDAHSITLMCSWTIKSMNFSATQQVKFWSCILQVTGAFENVFMSHSSWFIYQATMRIYKHYDLNVDDPATAAKRVSFSSYPGKFEEDLKLQNYLLREFKSPFYFHSMQYEILCVLHSQIYCQNVIQFISIQKLYFKDGDPVSSQLFLRHPNMWSNNTTFVHTYIQTQLTLSYKNISINTHT